MDVDMTVPSARCPPDAETSAASGGTAPHSRAPGPAHAEIAGLQWLSATVLRVVLKLSAETAFDFRCGQYLAVIAEDGRRRCFSMAAPPAAGLLELHVRHRPQGGFSHWLAAGARLGDLINVAGPYGNFIWRSERSAGVILLATGTGIAPMSAMLTRRLAEAAARVPIRLYWGVRGERELYRALLFRRWEKIHPHFAFIPVVSQGGDAGGGLALRVQDRAIADAVTLRGVDVYASGSPAMVTEARAKFLARPDMAPDRFFSDAFEPADSAAPVEPATPAMTVRLHRAGNTAAVPARLGERLLAALKRADIPLLAVCGGQASCATCKVEIAAPWRARLPPAGTVERNLLASLPDTKPGDRLACQIALTTELDGLEFCPSG